MWLLARVTQLFKSGQKSNLSKYRPISVLSVFPRLLEKLAHNQLYDAFRSNDLSSKNQFACRKLHSTITSMFNITEAWYKKIDEHKLNMSIFMGLKKSFRHVWLSYYVIKAISTWHPCENTLLVQKIPKNGKQFCYFEGQKSPASNIDYGIPQGSCLGPLLFIIYINDFERSLQGTTPNMHDDDTKITCSSSNSASLQRNIGIERWPMSRNRQA